MTCKLFAAASACAFLGAAFAGTPSFAQDDGGQTQSFSHGEYAQMIVGTHGLDLQSNEGARNALGRIKYAATVFCENIEGNMDIGRKLEARTCKDRMTYLAVRELDAPLVTARYYETGGKPPVRLANR
jgi:UrcA family protein